MRPTRWYAAALLTALLASARSDSGHSTCSEDAVPAYNLVRRHDCCQKAGIGCVPEPAFDCTVEEPWEFSSGKLLHCCTMMGIGCWYDVCWNEPHHKECCDRFHVGCGHHKPADLVPPPTAEEPSGLSPGETPSHEPKDARSPPAEWDVKRDECKLKDRRHERDAECCREFNYCCKHVPLYDCPAEYNHKSGGHKQAQYCCREFNVCPGYCVGDGVDPRMADICCGHFNICNEAAVKQMQAVDRKRDEAEMKNGKVKVALEAAFRGSYSTLEANPEYTLGLLRRAVLQKSSVLRNAAAEGTAEVYITRIGRLLKDGSYPATAEDMAAHSIGITRVMNDAWKDDEDTLLADGAFAVDNVKRGAGSLPVFDSEDKLFFLGEMMGSSSEQMHSAYAEIHDHHAYIEGDYGKPFTFFGSRGTLEGGETDSEGNLFFRTLPPAQSDAGAVLSDEEGDGNDNLLAHNMPIIIGSGSALACLLGVLLLRSRRKTAKAQEETKRLELSPPTSPQSALEMSPRAAQARTGSADSFA
eukprot:TRINITY_DN22830_c0_g1_i1.p1 TRINITY_DN22830_c0_g1~~TRINITY_DN22830_c0_g1_i1.p1  ORF type:complete len:527 (+),score=75.45 TRINITY_DN22830_c0_g1_i1:72-1652(+)